MATDSGNGRAVTLDAVARAAGVSRATVSRVVNGHPTVDPALAARVQRSLDELKYRPNLVARNLRRSRTTLWAVIVSNIENPYFTSVLRGVESVAQAAGFAVVLCNTDEDLEKEAQYVAAVVAERMAGVIISPASERLTDVSPLVERGVPIVAIDRQVEGPPLDTVLVDNESGAHEATAHLLQSYRRVACITGPRRVTTAERRRRGYESALGEAGVRVDEELVRHADYRPQGGHDAMTDLLALREPPDAVFVANNVMALGALEALAEQGVRVPEELGFVEFDDAPWAALTRPSLSAVAQPTQDVGRRAAELLTARIADATRPVETVTLPARLVLRESSQPRRT